METLPKVDGISYDLGDLSSQLSKAILQAQSENLVTRIWERDYTLWKPQPDEISNRLGWLDVAKRNLTDVADLQKFAQAVKADGITGALLLGMGGSSLAPDLYAAMFDSQAHGVPVDVLDSTDPAAVLEKASQHDPAKTLFIVSSKSGGTAETLSFFKFFYNRTVEQLGQDAAGSHFVAITDPGSKLAKLGEDLGFRRVFLADPTIGGRYSALTKFGLVPAALIGVDLKALLHSAEEMANRCHAELDKNPGALLGLIMGSLALAGHDKATFQLPPAFATFADWVEQLIAESTGKEGRGILPVAHEPQQPEDAYGDDRLFIGLGSQPAQSSPAVHVGWDSQQDLGGQFFLWEFATAVAGYVLDINAFNQPNVEAAKVQARHFVDEYQKTGQLPPGNYTALTPQALDEFLAQAKPGDYIALQAYVAPNSDLTQAFQALRERLGAKYHLATTLGYGPRFLHSTGQLHKGDGGHGLFVQFVSPPPSKDVPIPNEPGSQASDIAFGVLKTAQALGDAHALSEAGRRVISFQVDEADLVRHIKELG